MSILWLDFFYDLIRSAADTRLQWDLPSEVCHNWSLLEDFYEIFSFFTPFLSLIYNFSMKIWHNLRFLIIHFETLMYKSCILFSVLQLKTCPTLTCIWSAMLLEYAGKAPVIARDTPLWQIYCFPKLPPHVTGRQTLWTLVC